MIRRRGWPDKPSITEHLDGDNSHGLPIYLDYFAATMVDRACGRKFLRLQGLRLRTAFGYLATRRFHGLVSHLRRSCASARPITEQIDRVGNHLRPHTRIDRCGCGIVVRGRWAISWLISSGCSVVFSRLSDPARFFDGRQSLAGRRPWPAGQQ